MEGGYSKSIMQLTSTTLTSGRLQKRLALSFIPNFFASVLWRLLVRGTNYVPGLDGGSKGKPGMSDVRDEYLEAWNGEGGFGDGF